LPGDGAPSATVAMQQQDPALVRDVTWQFVAQSSERDIDRVGDVPALEFVRRANVDNKCARLQVLSGDLRRHERSPLQGEETNQHEGGDNPDSPVHKGEGATKFQHPCGVVAVLHVRHEPVKLRTLKPCWARMRQAK
jgi:hypothetical protein